MRGSGDRHIYTLTDPRDGMVKYVGATVNIRRRYWNHASQVSNPRRHEWVCALRAASLRPTLTILEVASEAEWEAREQFWIAFYRSQGAPLFNLSPGGSLAAPVTDETRKKIGDVQRGKPKGPPSEEHRRHISEARKGKPLTPEHRAKLRKPKTLTEEQRRAHSERHRARLAMLWQDPEYRAKMGAVTAERNRRQAGTVRGRAA